MISMEFEIARFPDFYPDMDEIVYAPKWYYSPKVKPDEYSHKIVQSKKVDIPSYFIDDLKQVMNQLIEDGTLNNLDIITIIPSSMKGTYSPTLKSLGFKLSKFLDVPYEQLIDRDVETGRKNVAGNTAIDRYNLIKDSMKLNRKLSINEKKIMILDDVKVSGITLLESKKILLDAGAEETLSVCLGINRIINWDEIKTVLGEKK